MRTKREFYKEYTDLVKKHIRAMKDKTDALHEIDEKEEMKIYDNNMLNNQRARIKQEMADLAVLNEKECKALCDDYIVELSKASALNGEDITPDAKLLNAGVKLDAKDLKSIIDRNNDNITMTKLVLRYADEHDVDIGLTYHDPYEDTIRVVSGLPYSSKVAEKWFEKDSVYEQIFGEQSESTRYFMSE